MKKLTKTSTVSGYLETIYNVLNIDFFNGELETPVITIMSTPNAYGHVSTSRIWEQGEKESYELNMGAGTLKRPIENTVATMLHEMVHIYHLQNGIRDTSRGNTYHNKRFKQTAEEVGLTITHHPKYGWSITEPSDRLIEYVRENRWESIPLNRNEKGQAGEDDDSDGEGKKRKQSSTRKYICPECGISCRATKDIYIICGICKQEMIKED